MFRKIFLSVILLFSFIREPASAYAQDLGLESIAPQIGITYAPNTEEKGLMTGIYTNFGELSEGIEIYSALSYWYAEKDDHSRSAIQFSTDVKYFFAATSGFYVGGGLSINYESEKSDGNSDKETNFRPGGALVLGNEQFFGKNIWFIQLKFDAVSDYKAISLSTGLFFDLYR